MESRRPASLIAAALIALFSVTHAIGALRQIEVGFGPTERSEIGLEERTIPIPPERTPIDLTGLRGIRIEVGAFVDRREDPTLLGEQRTFDAEGVVRRRGLARGGGQGGPVERHAGDMGALDAGVEAVPAEAPLDAPVLHRRRRERRHGHGQHTPRGGLAALRSQTNPLRAFDAVTGGR